jgi:hypothetical protein
VRPFSEEYSSSSGQMGDRTWQQSRPPLLPVHGAEASVGSAHGIGAILSGEPDRLAHSCRRVVGPLGEQPLDERNRGRWDGAVRIRKTTAISRQRPGSRKGIPASRPSSLSHRIVTVLQNLPCYAEA